MRLFKGLASVAAAGGAALALLPAAAVAAPGSPGAVFTSTNASPGNSVLVYDRAADGSLRPAGSVATGGTGTGAGLGDQGAIALSREGLFVVNAGSNDISSFVVKGDRLTPAGRVPSGGQQPISVTVHDDVLYVLNAGGAGNVSGFRVARDGTLTPIAGSTRPLAGSGPAEVAFTPDGGALLVTEKATNTIDRFPVGPAGVAGDPVGRPSNGPTPFGFAFDGRGHALVSEAGGGPGGTSAVSSYGVGPGGSLSPISPSVPNNQHATCWVTVTKNGRFAYTANTGSGTVSGYRVAHDGSIALLDPSGVTAQAGAAPSDAAQSESSRGLFVLSQGSGTIEAYRIHGDGSLTTVDVAAGVPASATGLAAR